MKYPRPSHKFRAPAQAVFWGYNVGNALSVWSIGHLTKIGFAGAAITTVFLIWAYRRGRPLPHYQFHPRDCPDGHLWNGYIRICPRCALEIDRGED